LRVSFDEREWVSEFEVKPDQHLKLVEPGTSKQK
jgi:hypothetical protein